MAARTVKTSAEVLESITPPAVEPEVVETPSVPPVEIPPEPAPVVAEAPPAPVVEAPVVPEMPEAGKPFIRFQFNTIYKIQFPDKSEYLAMPGIHDITDLELASKLTRFIERPGAKTALFRLSP